MEVTDRIRLPPPRSERAMSYAGKWQCLHSPYGIACPFTGDCMDCAYLSIDGDEDANLVSMRLRMGDK